MPSNLYQYRRRRKGGYRGWYNAPDMQKNAILLFIALLSVACGGLKTPRPEFTAPEPYATPAVAPSKIEIPVTVHLKPIIDKAESAVPKEFDSAGWRTVGTNPIGDMGVRYKLWRDPLEITVRGSTLRLSIHAYYWLNVGHRIKSGLLSPGEYPWMQFGSCGQGGEPPREMVFTMETDFSWNQNWGIVAKTRILPNSHPLRCIITALNIDVTNALDADVRTKLAAAGAMVDQKIAGQTDFLGLAKNAWERVQQPLELDEGIWLLPNPESIHVSPISGDGEKMETALGIVARPAVALGAKPRPTPTPLPEMTVAEKGDGLFRIALHGELPFEEAGRQLTKRLSQKPILVEKREVVVEAAGVYPSGGLCALWLKVKGSINGIVYFLGKPVFDVENNTISFENLDYTIETQSVLDRMGDWLLHDDFRKSLQKRVRFKIEGELENARAKIEKALNRPVDEHTSVLAKVTDVRMESFFMTSKAFKSVVVARGSAQIIWK